jgi:hypothetical protein
MDNIPRRLLIAFPEWATMDRDQKLPFTAAQLIRVQERILEKLAVPHGQ